MHCILGGSWWGRAFLKFGQILKGVGRGSFTNRFLPPPHTCGQNFMVGDPNHSACLQHLQSLGMRLCSKLRFLDSALTCRPLGKLSYLRIWHDNSGGGTNASWYLKYIVINDPQTHERFHFICNRWLAVELGDGQVRGRVQPDGRVGVGGCSQMDGWAWAGAARWTAGRVEEWVCRDASHLSSLFAAGPQQCSS